MPKFRVSISYDITMYETYEVEVLREDYDSDEEYQEALEMIEEAPYDLCDMTNRTDKESGDVRDGSWHEDVEEINALEQMATALTECDDQSPVVPSEAVPLMEWGTEWEDCPFDDCEHCNGSGKSLM